MILKIVISVGVLIALVVVLAALKPRTFRIQRSIRIDAAPDRVFPLISDLYNWARWAPQDREDSSMKRTYSGSAIGAGAVSDWTGSGSSGRGRMLITESEPLQRITVQVDWVKPFVTRNVNEFVLQAEENSTKVTWTMNGPNLLIMRLTGIFVNMDRMMGKHFEAGLANMKEVTEHGPE